MGNYKKKYNVLTTKKIDIKPKKMGKIKIKKSKKAEASGSYKEYNPPFVKGGIKGPFEGKGFAFREDDLRESTNSEMKDFDKSDLSQSINSEIRESNKSEMEKVGNNFGFEQKNFGKDSNFEIEDMRRDNKAYNNVQIFTSSYSKGSDVKNIKK